MLKDRGYWRYFTHNYHLFVLFLKNKTKVIPPIIHANCKHLLGFLLTMISIYRRHTHTDDNFCVRLDFTDHLVIKVKKKLIALQIEH